LLAFDDPAKGADLFVTEVGTVALALDAQALFKGIEDFVIAHA
jgi:hypothetical protein